MKVFSFIGSRRGEGSTTYQVVKRIVENLSHNYNIQENIVTADKLNLQPCQGCTACFFGSQCPMDKQDGFNKVKESICASDVIIFGSPVYAGTVAGDMKIFLDRISSWLHLMPCLGKFGVSVVSASSNHLIETNTYQKKMMETLGLSIASEVLFTTDAPAMLQNPTFFEQTIPYYVDMLKKTYNSIENIRASSYQKTYFNNYKEKLLLESNRKSFEFKFWEEKGYLRDQDLDAILLKKAKEIRSTSG